MLESRHGIIGEAHDDAVTPRFSFPPLVGPDWTSRSRGVHHWRQISHVEYWIRDNVTGVRWDLRSRFENRDRQGRVNVTRRTSSPTSSRLV